MRRLSVRGFRRKMGSNRPCCLFDQRSRLSLWFLSNTFGVPRRDFAASFGVIIGYAVASETTENRRFAAILAADVVGFSRLAAADEDRTLARLRALRSDLIDPTIAVHKGRVVKRTGEGFLSNFEALSTQCAALSKCSTACSNAMPACQLTAASNSGSASISATWSRRRTVTMATAQHRRTPRGDRQAQRDLPFRTAYRQVKGRLDLVVHDLGQTQLKNIAEPIRVYSLDVAAPRRRSLRRP